QRFGLAGAVVDERVVQVVLGGDEEAAGAESGQRAGLRRHVRVARRRRTHAGGQDGDAAEVGAADEGAGVVDQNGVDDAVGRGRGGVGVGADQGPAFTQPVHVGVDDLVVLFVFAGQVDVQRVVEQVLAPQEADTLRGLAVL